MYPRIQDVAVTVAGIGPHLLPEDVPNRLRLRCFSLVSNYSRFFRIVNKTAPSLEMRNGAAHTLDIEVEGC